MRGCALYGCSLHEPERKKAAPLRKSLSSFQKESDFTRFNDFLIIVFASIQKIQHLAFLYGAGSMVIFAITLILGGIVAGPYSPRGPGNIVLVSMFPSILCIGVYGLLFIPMIFIRPYLWLINDSDSPFSRQIVSEFENTVRLPGFVQYVENGLYNSADAAARIIGPAAAIFFGISILTISPCSIGFEITFLHVFIWVALKVFMYAVDSRKKSVAYYKSLVSGKTISPAEGSQDSID